MTKRSGGIRCLSRRTRVCTLATCTGCSSAARSQPATTSACATPRASSARVICCMISSRWPRMQTRLPRRTAPATTSLKITVLPQPHPDNTHAEHRCGILRAAAPDRRPDRDAAPAARPVLRATTNRARARCRSCAASKMVDFISPSGRPPFAGAYGPRDDGHAGSEATLQQRLTGDATGADEYDSGPRFFADRAVGADELCLAAGKEQQLRVRHDNLVKPIGRGPRRTQRDPVAVREKLPQPRHLPAATAEWRVEPNQAVPRLP